MQRKLSERDSGCTLIRVHLGEWEGEIVRGERGKLHRWEKEAPKTRGVKGIDREEISYGNGRCFFPSFLSCSVWDWPYNISVSMRRPRLNYTVLLMKSCRRNERIEPSLCFFTETTSPIDLCDIVLCLDSPLSRAWHFPLNYSSVFSTLSCSSHLTYNFLN